MKVQLLSHTENPVKVIACAARSCYSEDCASSIIDNISEEKAEKVIDHIISIGHYSVLEHASFTFSIEGVSRALTHQLVRHRLASFSQQSQRYVNFSDFSIYVPESIKQDVVLLTQYADLIQNIQNMYQYLVENGISEEDARYILPNAALTNIVVTMNARELYHFFKLRCCRRAQKEIRDVAWEMLGILFDKFPEIFKYAGPSCLRGKCTEGDKSCGNPYTK